MEKIEKIKTTINLKQAKEYDCDLLLEKLEKLDEKMDNGHKVLLNVD